MSKGDKTRLLWEDPVYRRKQTHAMARGENHWAYKGTEVGYHALHVFVKRRYKKPKKCEKCKSKRSFDLANKGIYDRVLTNWWYLCRGCHMKSDGRFQNLKQFNV